MKKKKWAYIFLAISIILIILSLVLSQYPIYKTRVINDVKMANVVAKGDEYLKVNGHTPTDFKVEIRDNYVQALQIYSEWSVAHVDLDVSLIDDANNLIYHNVFASINNNAPTIILFDKPLLNREGENLTMTVEILSDHNLYMKKNADNNIYVDEYSQEKSYGILFILYVLLAITIFGFLYNVMTIEKKEFPKLIQIVTILGYFIGSLCLSSFLLYAVYQSTFRHRLSLKLDISIILVLIFILSLAVYLFKKYPKDMSKLFLLIAIPITSFYCIFFMPGDGQDGIRHYARAYSLTTEEALTNNELVSIPSAAPYMRGFANVKELYEKLKESTDYNDTYQANYANYIPILYLVPALGIFIGKVLSLNLYVGWYIAKIFNLAISLLIGYFLMKRIPKKYQLLLFLYFLIPMHIYQYVTLSADIMINFATLWLIVWALNRYEDERKLSFLDFLQIIICGYIITFGKMGYYAVILALLFMARKSIKKSNKWAIVSSIALILFLGLGWNILLKTINSPIITPTYNNLLFKEMGIKFVLSNPLQTMTAFMNYLLNAPEEYLLNFVGYKFVWSSKSVPITYAAAYLLILLIAGFNNEKAKKFDWKTIVALIFAFIITFGLITLGMYAMEMHSNPLLGSIWGVQGRYFIPIYLLLFICLSNQYNIFKTKKETFCLVSLGIIQMLYMYQFMLFVI